MSSTFAKLKSSFGNLYELLNCADCKRKIDLQEKCIDCKSLFCTECLFQMKKTKICKSCKSTNTIKTVKNRNAFVQELVELIQIFDRDTGNAVHLIKGDFLNVESFENLERIYDKEKVSVFNQQKLFATSTPNINNAKKVVFNTDITMIPQNNKQIESVDKNNSKRSNSSSSNNSKRKADSMNEKQENTRSSKKARLASNEEEEENAKENLKDQVELDKQQQTEKQPQQSSTTKKNSSLQNKDKDHHHEDAEVCKKNSNALQEKDLDNNIQANDNQTKKLEEENNQLKEKIKLLEEKKEFEERSIQLIREQIKEQMREQMKEQMKEQINDQMKIFMKEQLNEFKRLNEEHAKELSIVGLMKIASKNNSPITSSIDLDKLGKINITIEPFKKIEQPKKIMKNITTQTDKIKVGEFYIQTEETVVKQLIDANVQCEKMELDEERQSQKISNTQENEIRQVVSKVVEECNGMNGKHLNGDDKLNDEDNRPNTTNKSTFSVQFDESIVKDSKEIVINNKVNQNDDVLDSDEIKKRVEDSEIFDSEDEVAPSSPIYE